MKPITENIIEASAIEILQSLGWVYVNGKEISPEGLFCERENFGQVVLTIRLRSAISEINPHIPADALDAAIQKMLRIASSDVLHNNEEFHRMLVEKVKIPYQHDGYERSHEVALIDFDNPANNQYLVVNQFTIIENNHNKRPDVLLFVNGIPLVVMELKNATDENANMLSAFKQIQTYKATIPGLFTYNGVCIISDGLECKAGSLSADRGRYMAWKTSDGLKDASRFKPQLVTLLKGMLQPATLLDLIRNCTVFEKTKKEDVKTGLIQIQTEKKLAAYHQYYAVNKAVESTLRASSFQFAYATPSQKTKGSNYRGNFEYSGLLSEARKLRQDQTNAEEMFWQLVRNRKFLNLKFRRQHQIGLYIADFYCDEKRLVVEFDGDVHSNPGQHKHDITRDKFLTSSGFKVVRFKNEELLNNPEKVFAKLLSEMEPSPLGRGQGEGDRRGGVIWHTQGSGKSLSMVFYAGKLITAPEMQNPTIVVITDRNDLDDQLFDTFAGSRQLLRQEPVQAENRAHLKELLKVASGGIVFTTIQKFLPENNLSVYSQLSGRKNIIVIADEAHRTQYGFEAKIIDEKDPVSKEVIGKRIAYGFAKYVRDALPNATYIGFTGTPIERTDVNTPQVFGQYVDV